jgi:hypothetical protein
MTCHLYTCMPVMHHVMGVMCRVVELRKVTSVAHVVVAHEQRGERGLGACRAVVPYEVTHFIVIGAAPGGLGDKICQQDVTNPHLYPAVSLYLVKLTLYTLALTTHAPSRLLSKGVMPTHAAAAPCCVGLMHQHSQTGTTGSQPLPASTTTAC